jgi:hypothetical protein
VEQIGQGDYVAANAGLARLNWASGQLIDALSRLASP